METSLKVRELLARQAAAVCAGNARAARRKLIRVMHIVGVRQKTLDKVRSFKSKTYTI